MKKITDPRVKQALLALATEEVAHFEALPAVAVAPSAAFARKIEKLARAQARWTWSLVKTTRRRIITIITIIALLLASTLSISAIREPVISFFTEVLPQYTNFWVKYDNKAPKTIPEYRFPQWIPEGYTQTAYSKGDAWIDGIWKTEAEEISFSQSLASNTFVSIDNTNTNTTKETICEKEIYVSQKNGLYSFLWYDEVCVYTLTVPTSLGWETALRIIEGIAAVQ